MIFMKMTIPIIRILMIDSETRRWNFLALEFLRVPLWIVFCVNVFFFSPIVQVSVNVQNSRKKRMNPVIVFD
jgi:hypothetical protein